MACSYRLVGFEEFNELTAIDGDVRTRAGCEDGRGTIPLPSVGQPAIAGNGDAHWLEGYWPDHHFTLETKKISQNRHMKKYTGWK